MNLSEKYRPHALAEVVGQDKAVRMLERVGRSGYGGRAYWLTGKSGTGKTTLARIIAGSVADPKWGTWETTGRQTTVADVVTWRDKWSAVSWLTPGYALIVNEAHGLSRPVVEVMLDVLEALPSNVVVVFTTTVEGNELFEDRHIDAGPFASRCLCLALSGQGVAKPFAEHLRKIALAEGLDGKGPADYLRLIYDCNCNLRAAIGAVESGRMLA